MFATASDAAAQSYSSSKYDTPKGTCGFPGSSFGCESFQRAKRNVALL